MFRNLRGSLHSPLPPSPSTFPERRGAIAPPRGGPLTSPRHAMRTYRYCSPANVDGWCRQYPGRWAGSGASRFCLYNFLVFFMATKTQHTSKIHHNPTGQSHSMHPPSSTHTQPYHHRPLITLHHLSSTGASTHRCPFHHVQPSLG